MFRSKKKFEDDEDIEMQIIDWYPVDVIKEEYENVSLEEKDQDFDGERLEHVIKIFGVDNIGRSISANVLSFKPYFYVHVEDLHNTKAHLVNIKKHVIDFLPKKFSKDVLQVNVVKKEKLYGFTNNTKYEFVRIEFENYSAMRSLHNQIKLKKKKYNMQCADKILIYGKMYTIKLYESNIEPFIRFIHKKNIRPSGWIKFPNSKYCKSDRLLTKCQYNVDIHWTDVESIDNTNMAEFLIASFDIECTSSHGDFPVAKKKYTKTATEIYELYTELIAKKTPDVDIKRIATHELGRIFNIYIDNMKDTLYNESMSEKDDVAYSSTMKIYDELSAKLSTVYPKTPVTNSTVIHDRISDIHEHMMNKRSYKMDNSNIETDEEKFINSFNKQITSQTTKEEQIDLITRELSQLPELHGDQCIQIGTTVHRYGEKECFYKNVITLGTCDDLSDTDVISCKTEKKVLLEWSKLINKIDPDIITGYNILGFDFEYMVHRSEELGCKDKFMSCGRLKDIVSEYKNKVLSSSALGDNELKYINMEGRVIIDMMKVIQRDHKLDSYKLDHVAANFIKGKISDVIETDMIRLDSTCGLSVGNYIVLGNNSKDKREILEIKDNNVVRLKNCDKVEKMEWGMVKDDISPRDIFNCQSGNSRDRSKIAKYCVQDCALCNNLIIKLEIIANNMGMSNVCSVPLSYIFMRGQGIKIFSLVAKQCAEDGYLVPVLNNNQLEDESQDGDNDGYEGAIVLDPKPGIYIEDPVSVLDYASLYPSSMISENISHDSIVLDNRYANMDFDYVDIIYDEYVGIGDKKRKIGEKKCRYVQFPENKKGILPRILMKLLSQRKATRKKATEKKITCKNGQIFTGFITDQENNNVITIKSSCDNSVNTIKNEEIQSIEDSHNEFTKAVLDGLQLAYKVTANSLYGQVGAKTSPIYLKDLAASTTATGRKLIIQAKDFMEREYDAITVYGDTDSVFMNFRIKEKYGLTGKEAIQKSIDIATEAGKKFNKQCLKPPHDLEYEKTFWPFVILSKKRYVGNLYETDVNKYKQKSMGIVLKRRDNANIVKIIYGGLIDILLSEYNTKKAVQFVKQCLHKLINGFYDIKDLTITKTLRGNYKDPTKIAHKVLADRMKERDPGSAPQVNDRIPFVYIINPNETKSHKVLQGEKIEHPNFILSNSKIKIDYNFYITNQLLKPISQLLSLKIEDMDEFKKPKTFYVDVENKYLKEYDGNIKKTYDKIGDLKQLEVKKILFDPFISCIENKNKGQCTLDQFYKTSSTTM